MPKKRVSAKDAINANTQSPASHILTEPEIPDAEAKDEKAVGGFETAKNPGAAAEVEKTNVGKDSDNNQEAEIIITSPATRLAAAMKQTKRKASDRPKYQLPAGHKHFSMNMFGALYDQIEAMSFQMHCDKKDIVQAGASFFVELARHPEIKRLIGKTDPYDLSTFVQSLVEEALQRRKEAPLSK